LGRIAPLSKQANRMNRLEGPTSNPGSGRDAIRNTKAEPFFGCGKSLFKAVCDLDLEGIIAKSSTIPTTLSGPSGGKL
jgi:ATP-dependent DNA ligase